MCQPDKHGMNHAYPVDTPDRYRWYMSAFYNEIEPFAAQWLRNLIGARHIAEGHVDERSIAEVAAGDIRAHNQCHFFAGIGVWSYALRLAGWPDDRPVWTGSCPCQPFSVAGKGRGVADTRHLWPVWFRLIQECRPGVIFGEQVASPDGLAWLDAVHSDLEGEGYAVGAVDLCAAGVGAPHQRQRLYFVAHTYRSAFPLAHSAGSRHGVRQESGESRTDEEGQLRKNRQDPRILESERGRYLGGVADTNDTERRAESPRRQEPDRQATGRDKGDGDASVSCGPCNGFWRDAEWIACLDGKLRSTEPGTFPLAHGATARMGRLRGYGNAIVAHAAAEVVRAYMTATTGGV